VIFVDANIFMYAAGAAHTNKGPSVEFLRQAASGEIEVCTDAEVFQEVLHRYRAIGRWEDGRHVFGLVSRIIPVVHPVDRDVMEQAVDILDRHPALMARDGLHAAVCAVHGITKFCSYDRDFDEVAELRRITPY